MRPHRRAVEILALAGVGAAHVVVLGEYRIILLGPALGFWLLFLNPVRLLAGTSLGRGKSVAERYVLAVVAQLLLLLAGGLALNLALPAVGVDRPLDTGPVLGLADLITLGLMLAHRLFADPVDWAGIRARTEPREPVLAVLAAAAVGAAVTGAIRLNNGAGGQISLVALGLVTLTVALGLLWRHRVRDGALAGVLYGLSAALLLMNSLRGWSITGHDIQLEYRVFQLTASHGHWDIAGFRDPYNACLSITILPVEIARLVAVPDPYIYKVFFQLIFAVCPVLVYLIGRRFWSRPIAWLGAVYFIGFPTFVNDLSFLNRQEIGFLFAGAGFLIITSPEWTLLRRRTFLVAAAAGLELAHYSTMYLFLGILGVAWVLQRVTAVPPALRRLWARRKRARPTTVATAGLGTIMLIGAVTFAWGGLVTHTAQGVVGVAQSAVGGLFGPSDPRSGVVSYSIFSSLGSPPQTPQQQMAAYTQDTLATRAQDPSLYVPDAQIPAQPVTDPFNAPLTAAGRALDSAHIPVTTLNTVVRQLAARGEQAFVVIGLIVLVVLRRNRRVVSREFSWVAVASVLMVGLVTVLPGLSVEYGLLRAFQEALIVLAPILVVGSVTAVRWLGAVWAPRAAAAIALVFFVSTTGFLPTLLGGYPSQLTLANRGLYYDIYYTHPEELQVVDWLADQPGVLPDRLQTSYATDRFAFTAPGRVTGQQLVSGLYPTLVRRDSWVVVGWSTLHTGRASLVADSDILTYMYPTDLLPTTKNLVYTNGGAEVYR